MKFKIYDLDYNSVSLPVDRLGYGMNTPGDIGFDVTISSIIYENIYTQSSYTDTLVKRYPKDRTATVTFSIVAADEIDWRLKRDEVYEFFRRLGVFYIAEEYQPFKLLKVTVDDGYNIEALNAVWGRGEIPLKVVDTPFKRSLHTTADIDAEGMQFNNKWAYGMGTWFAENYWQYSFTNEDPTFYNAGTEEVKLIQQKDSVIELVAQEEVPWVEIYDGVTTFRLDRRLYPGGRLTIEGHKVRVNNANVMDQANGEFLTVENGWNYWEVRGINQFEFKIDFRYLYD